MGEQQVTNLRWAAVLSAALTAALNSTAWADDPVVVEGLVWFDRNANGVVDEGEPPLANGRAVRVFNGATKEFIGEFGTDATGRYRASVPDVPLAIYNHNTDVYRATTKSSFFPKEGGGTFDFGIRGATVWGHSFWDVNQDGVKQDDERALPQPGTGEPYSLDGRLAEHPGLDGIQRIHDVPDGEHTFSPGKPGAAESLILSEPLNDHDLDWRQPSRKVLVAGGHDVRLDARYFAAEYDPALGPLGVTPDRDTYAVGDVLEVVVPLHNRGNAPVRIGLQATSRFEVVRVDGAVEPWLGIWQTREHVPAGERVDVTVTLKLTEPVHEVRFRAVIAESDVDTANNESFVEFTMAGAPTTTTTTTVPTTTTAAPVVVAGNDGGLAETGASPGMFLITGGLLVGGGALTYLAARRRRA